MSDSERSFAVDDIAYKAPKNDPAFRPMAEFVPYPETKTDVDSWLEVGELILKNFQMHERTQYAEFIFLCLGIIYFLEAIIKNTMEMLGWR